MYKDKTDSLVESDAANLGSIFGNIYGPGIISELRLVESPKFYQVWPKNQKRKCEYIKLSLYFIHFLLKKTSIQYAFYTTKYSI